MGRLLRALRHCIREAWDGLWRNAALSLLSAAAIGISLYVLGLFLLLAFNLNRFVEDLGREMQVQVYLQENATVDQIRPLRAAFAALVTVGATVRLTVLARREEIEIMKLVGATAGFIRGPFMLAAAAQGLAGGVLAVAGLLLTHRLVERADIVRANPFMSIVAGRFLPSGAALALAAVGAALGIVAAVLSLRRAGTVW